MSHLRSRSRSVLSGGIFSKKKKCVRQKCCLEWKQGVFPHTRAYKETADCVKGNRCGGWELNQNETFFFVRASGSYLLKVWYFSNSKWIKFDFTIIYHKSCDLGTCNYTNTTAWRERSYQFYQFSYYILLHIFS